ncbi:hypothetical protein EOI86_10060 [Hwanghaeella grinnelliae]|uniref:Cytochrome c domain-containing protein n=1 Tax=Hwanghaeella grinnelliae TaxID=2500179 RepID=A0A437QYE4_9PROT|nr:cytochrome c3 family protein [Hwanghaeella grinnelliae]RVU39547.1 hypothetical protein EOI86_10060 [Hwanghaeella grinnelliae]
MNLKLQRFDYRSSPYERPNQEWVCGRLAEGKPCLVGPGGNGVCRAQSECRPLMKDGRWICTRSDAAGGKCSQGPAPDGSCCNPIPKCSPKPSIRRQRGMLSRYVVAVVVGLLLVLAGGMTGEAVFSPGPLSAAHSELGGCASCHTVSGKGMVAWAHSMFTGGSETSDIQNCLGCHENRGGNPHNQTSAFLAAASEDAAARGGEGGGPLMTRVSAVMGLSVPEADGGGVACRTCHQEHGGHQNDITKMSNSECQACHTTKFNAIGDGHPEFGAYPYLRRTRIAFDHQAHIGKYFVDPNNADKAPGTCRTCHVPDTQGKLMLFAGFDTGCASCHAPFIADKPVEILKLPGMDVDSLIDMEADTGEYPAYAEGEEFQAIGDALMRSDEGYAAARAYIEEEDLDLFDLADIDEDGQKHIENLIWAYKTLIYDILTQGPEAIQERLSAASDADLNQKQVADLMAGLHIDAVSILQQRWFPNLFEEMEAHLDGTAQPMPEDEGEEYELPDGMLEEADWSEGGGWYVEYFTLNYKLTGHGDKFMRDWLRFAVVTNQDEELGASLMDAIGTPKSPGGCVGCHSVDKTDGPGEVNWKSRQPNPSAVGFTDFFHAKHFALIGDKGCSTCHELNPEADYTAGFTDFDNSTFTSNFSPLSQKVCADCHTESVAGNDCTQCHNYHVGEFPPAAVDTKLTAK